MRAKKIDDLGGLGSEPKALTPRLTVATAEFKQAEWVVNLLKRFPHQPPMPAGHPALAADALIQKAFKGQVFFLADSYRDELAYLQLLREKSREKEGQARLDLRLQLQELQAQKSHLGYDDLAHLALREHWRQLWQLLIPESKSSSRAAVLREKYQAAGSQVLPVTSDLRELAGSEAQHRLQALAYGPGLIVGPQAEATFKSEPAGSQAVEPAKRTPAGLWVKYKSS